VPLGALKIGRIAQGQGALFTNDVLNDDRLPNKEWMQQHGLRSFAGFALMVESQVFGVLGLFSRETISEPMRQTIESVCNSLAASIARTLTVVSGASSISPEIAGLKVRTPLTATSIAATSAAQSSAASQPRPPINAMLIPMKAASELIASARWCQASASTAELPVQTALLLGSDMVAPMSVELVKPYLDSGLLAVLPYELNLRMDVYGIITRRHHQLSPAAEAMLGALRETATRPKPTARVTYIKSG